MPTPPIEWNHDLILKLAPQCKTKRELGYEYAKATGQSIATNSLTAYLHRDGELRDQVNALLRTYAGTPMRPGGLAEDEVSREELLEQEVRELRAHFSKTRKADVHVERLTQAVEEAVGKFRPARLSTSTRTRASKATGAHHRALLCLSDFHGGEVVDPGVISQLNSYSWQVMEERIAELKASVISHVKNGPPLTGIDVLFVGDMNSGANHEEIAVTNEFPLAEQAVRMGAIEAQIVEDLATELGLQVRAGGVEGNHPRLTPKPAAKLPHNNGDWISNVIAAQHLENRGIPFEVGRGSMLWKIAGRTIYVWHGDGIRSSMPGVPWGGVMRRTNQIQATMPQRIDHFLHGHFHQANVVQGGRLIGNGALKGTDEWVTKNFGGGDPPTQLMLTFDERREWLTGVSYITPTAGIPS